MNKNEIVVGQKRNKIKAKADIAFLIDVTGSMDPCLEQFKNSLINLAAQIRTIAIEKYNAEDPEIGYNIIGFRDLEKDQDYKPIVMFSDEFTMDLNKIKEYLNSPDMAAKGGDDIEESALDALYIAATKLKWTRPARVIVLFTDAPPKKKLHPSTVVGQELDEKTSFDKVLQHIVAFRRIIFGPKGVEEYQKLCEENNGVYIGDEVGHKTLSSFENSDIFEKYIVKLIAKTVSDEATKELKS